MAKLPERASVPGPAFIRQLARLTTVDVPHSNRALSEQLGQWIDWNRAVMLSRALDGAVPAAPAGPVFDLAQAQACAAARSALAQAIADDAVLATTGPPGAGDHADAPAAEATAADYAPFRRRYLEHQRAMQAATGRLRGRLRDMLAAQSEQHARLAEVDALMELTLSAREHTLLAAVPELLGRHFERQSGAAQQAAAKNDLQGAPAAATGAWLDVFRKDIHAVLLGELDVRFQPIEGLLAALRTQSPGSHV